MVQLQLCGGIIEEPSNLIGKVVPHEILETTSEQKQLPNCIISQREHGFAVQKQPQDRTLPQAVSERQTSSRV